MIYARVAQWWSVALPRRRSRVRSPSRALQLPGLYPGSFRVQRRSNLRFVSHCRARSALSACHWHAAPRLALILIHRSIIVSFIRIVLIWRLCTHAFKILPQLCFAFPANIGMVVLLPQVYIFLKARQDDMQ